MVKSILTTPIYGFSSITVGSITHTNIEEKKTPREITLVEMQDSSAIDTTSEVNSSGKIYPKTPICISHLQYILLITSPLDVILKYVHDTVESIRLLKILTLLTTQIADYVYCNLKINMVQKSRHEKACSNQIIIMSQEKIEISLINNKRLVF
ncbi:orf152 (mitochondrion) [Beta vulgaris subsp. vulgaris]|uniref:Orf152 protein n=3 Tax=Beta TaxID=3554 RepID=Q9MFE6_BETVV|nr:orf152 [Beta vulgaris subsp. vulgaris]YP_004222243.1 hypothetical protein LKY74_mgp004 [Beta vulgaris subsp. maritima]YP_004842093.1 hypothetical protein LKY79_mgp115 [Beta macrocarpa]CBJ14028.1 hypothetical protein [Beta vulgaris subsp. maritima]CBJ17486.1 hypothetical protein [Beta vulgaris subsp. maritima]CBL52006.1 hypothetical protein [Beta vulgaris subsp. maritima]CBX24895.1 hypothetical protein [Beta macrocarpa]BAA99296.1 orf152 [Beta vulgaris subsp. vulgaris]